MFYQSHYERIDTTADKDAITVLLTTSGNVRIEISEHENCAVPSGEKPATVVSYLNREEAARLSAMLQSALEHAEKQMQR